MDLDDQEKEKKAYILFHIGLSTQPGKRAFTRTDRGASSRDRALVSPDTESAQIPTNKQASEIF